jgi:hypothetical protein
MKNSIGGDYGLTVCRQMMHVFSHLNANAGKKDAERWASPGRGRDCGPDLREEGGGGGGGGEEGGGSHHLGALAPHFPDGGGGFTLGSVVQVRLDDDTGVDHCS